MKRVRSVCIIDDDKIYRYTTEKYIRMLELAEEILTYADGEEAIEFFKANASNSEKLPDVILLDVNMPVMDGWDFMEEFSGLNGSLAKKILIYMVSSSIDERDRARALGIDLITDYIIKPITEDQLVTLLTKSIK